MSGTFGLDAGGTRSRWAWLDADGGVRRGDGPGIQVATVGVAAAAAAIDDLVAAAALACGDASQRPAAMVAGLAGAGDAATRARLTAELQRRGVGFPFAVVSDIEIAAFAAADGRPVVAVQSGTGSFAVAVDAESALHRVGGRGWWLGDEGSAFAVVRAAATAAVRAVDRLGPATALTVALAERFNVADVTRLGVALQSASPRDVAAALPTVEAIAAQGDPVAIDVLTTAGARLADLARAVARGARLTLAAVPVVAGGGALGDGSRLRAALEAALSADGIQRLGAPATDAATAAARLAAAWQDGRGPLSRWVARA